MDGTHVQMQNSSDRIVITLLVNACSQMPVLRQTRVLQVYNRDLVLWAQKREDKFIKATPMLFGQDFPKEVTEYLLRCREPRLQPTLLHWVFRMPPPTGHLPN